MVYWTSTHSVTSVARGLLGWIGRGSRLVAAVLMVLAWMGSSSAPLYAQFAHIDPLFFSKGHGGANPLPQILTVTSTGAPIGFKTSASTSTGGDWLAVSTTEDCCMTPAPVSVIVNANAALAAGSLLRSGRVHRWRYFAGCERDSCGYALGRSGVRPHSGASEFLHEARRQTTVPGYADRERWLRNVELEVDRKHFQWGQLFDCVGPDRDCPDEDHAWGLAGEPAKWGHNGGSLHRPTAVPGCGQHRDRTRKRVSGRRQSRSDEPSKLRENASRCPIDPIGWGNQSLAGEYDQRRLWRLRERKHRLR